MPQELFEPDTVQTACFGRMQLELPKGAELRGSLYRYPGADEGLETTLGVSRARFDEEVRSFAEHLRSTRHEKDPSLHRSTLELPGGDRLFVHWEYSGAVHLMDFTGFAWRDGVQYKLLSRSSLDNIQQGIDEARLALSSLRARAAGEVPGEHGFCLDTGFIPDQFKGEAHERAEVTFSVAPWDGVHVVVESEVNQVPPTERLLERLPMTAARWPGFDKGYQIIKAGRRTVGPYDGEELITRITDASGAFFLFVWEVQGAVRRNDPPDIHLELHVRQAGKPGEMTKEQALALWEYLLPRLKLRPVNAKAPTVSAAGKRAPLGERHLTGRACPQTGWWECDDELLLAQPSGVWLEEGQRMPMALVWREPSVWQWLKGERPVARTAAVWRLAAYENPPAQHALPVEADSGTAQPPDEQG